MESKRRSKRTETAGKSGVDSVYGITGMTQGNTNGTETIVRIDEINNLQGNVPTITGNMYAWNQKGGVTASTTMNMTGVYDMSGGTWERVASYIANKNENLMAKGKSIAYNGDILKTKSTKYTMVYPWYIPTIIHLITQIFQMQKKMQIRQVSIIT